MARPTDDPASPVRSRRRVTDGGVRRVTDGGVRRRAVCRVRACYAYNMAYNENDDLSTLERELRAPDGPRARYAARRH